MVNQVSSAGMRRVSAPSALAAMNIMVATKRTLESLLLFALAHMFPDSAISVIPIIRMDHFISADAPSRANRSRKNPGVKIRSAALPPKTTAPVRKVFLIPNMISKATRYLVVVLDPSIFNAMYDDEDWKEDLRNKKRILDEERAKNKKSWRRLSFVVLGLIALLGIFKG